MRKHVYGDAFTFGIGPTTRQCKNCMVMEHELGGGPDDYCPCSDEPDDSRDTMFEDSFDEEDVEVSVLELEHQVEFQRKAIITLTRIVDGLANVCQNLVDQVAILKNDIGVLQNSDKNDAFRHSVTDPDTGKKTYL